MHNDQQAWSLQRTLYSFACTKHAFGELPQKTTMVIEESKQEKPKDLYSFISANLRIKKVAFEFSRDRVCLYYQNETKISWYQVMARFTSLLVAIFKMKRSSLPVV